MIELYNFKIVQSGREIEVYDYHTKKMLRGYERKNQDPDEKEKITSQEFEELVELWGDESELEKLHSEQKQKTKFSIARTRTNIRRLTNSNPHLNKFLTLTFGYSMPDLKQANYIFNQAIKRIIRVHSDFEYIAVNEFQKDEDFYGRAKLNGGSVHYHLLCNIPTFEEMTQEKQFLWERRFAGRYWQQGFVKIKDVVTVTNMGAYFCKYLSKDMFDKRMFRKKKFFCSQTLNKPVELIGEKATRFFNRYVGSKQPIFEKTFKSEWTGEVDYKAYTLDLPLWNGLLNPSTAGQYDKHRAD